MKTGALNTLLAVFGAGPIGFTATEWGAKISIILVAVWTSTGWYATIYLAYLQAIPNEYYEAAAIDGASRWQQFTKITFPLLAPGLTVNTLLLLTNGLKVYDLPYALTKCIKNSIKQRMSHHLIFKNTDKIFQSHKIILMADSIKVCHAIHNCFYQRNNCKQSKSNKCR